MENINRYQKIQISSEKNFGIVFGIIFMLIFLYFYFLSLIFYLPLLLISILFFTVSYFFPRILYYPNKLWYYIGIFIGHFVSQFVMGAIFIFLLTPIGIYKSISTKNFFNIKIDRTKSTYWVNKNNSKHSMKNQY